MSTCKTPNSNSNEDGDPYYTEEEYNKIKQESEVEQEKIEMRIKG